LAVPPRHWRGLTAGKDDMDPITRRAALGTTLAVATVGAAHAQEWPSRPMRIIVPHAAGGGNDIIARLLAEWLRPALAQTIVVENRTGANGVVGADLVARGEPDGHLFLIIARTHAMNRVAMGNLPFHPVLDFTAVSMMARFPLVLVAHVGTPFNDIAGLISHARGNPGRVGSGISEPFVQYASALFARAARIELVDVPYRGSALILNDLVAGHVPIGWVSPLSVVPHLQSGRIRPLAVTTTRRIALLPDVPTMAESGLPDYECAGLYGLLGPPGLPAPIAQRMHGAIAAALADAERRARLEALGLELTAMGPAEFRDFLLRDDALWAEAALAGMIPRNH